MFFGQKRLIDIDFNKGTKICVPVMGENKKEVLKQAKAVINMQPDIIEWRIDYLNIKNKDQGDYYIHKIAKKLKKLRKDIPLIYTFRTKSEGGVSEISWELYKRYIISAIAYGDAEFFDVEMYRNKERIYELFDDLKEVDDQIKSRYKIIGSSHFFNITPSESEMEEILEKTKDLGADICKLAVMPKEKEDVERLILVSKKMKIKLGVPIITMSMGELGAVTRTCTNLTGSCITFGAGYNASAPGQIEFRILKKLLEINRGCKLDGNIVLIGFMGTGKTTISKALSRITGFREIDVDAYIVEKEKKSIRKIFEECGEEFFRERETEALKEIANSTGQIISCGGGAVLKDENVEILKKNGVIILLTATLETIFNRVKDHTHRPILNDDMSIEHIVRLMADREPRYMEVADIEVNVDSNDRVMTCYNMLMKLEEKGIVKVQSS